MGGRGRKIGGGVAQYNPAATQSFGGGAGAGGQLGKNMVDLLGLDGKGRPFGADPYETVNVGGINTTIPNPKTRGKGGGGTEKGGLNTGDTQINKATKTSKITTSNSKFTTFSNKEEAHSYFLANEDNFRVSANEAAKAGFNSYKGSSASFNTNGLRKTGGDPSSLSSYIQQNIKAMDAHMAQPGNALKKNTTLYRGIQANDKKLWQALNNPGAEFTDHGYVSFTGSKALARKGAVGGIVGGSGESIYLKVLAPKGMRGTYMERLTNWETEYLGERGIKFKVVSVDGKKGGINYFTVRAIPPKRKKTSSK